MADVTADGQEAPATRNGRKGLFIGLILALFGGGAAFAVTSGMVSLGIGGSASKATTSHDYAFVSIDPMTIPLGGSDERRFLRFRAELEVAASKKADVEKTLPRVMDVLNTYLRSLNMADIEDPSSLLTLRAQMRRRIDLVVGGDAVHDLLVMEFVVN